MPRPASTTARGYGRAHQLERERWRSTVAAGRATCCRCGEPITPGAAWDLDHTDDRTSYSGPAHRSCNRSAGARKGNAKRRQRQQVTRYTSTRW
jgi:hypothetical protein